MILVNPEEANIACTVVLLKGLWAIGRIPTPVPVELSLPGLEHHGWRQAAIDYLKAKEKEPKRRRKLSASKWEEINEELDFHDKRSHA